MHTRSNITHCIHEINKFEYFEWFLVHQYFDINFENASPVCTRFKITINDPDTMNIKINLYTPIKKKKLMYKKVL